jgi:hypothetical protein
MSRNLLEVLFVIAIFAVMAANFLIRAVITKARLRRSQSWPTAAGTILSAELKANQDHEGRNWDGVLYWDVEVTFSFDAGGKTLFSSFVTTAGDGKIDDARRYIQAIGGTKKVVRYEPSGKKNPVIVGVGMNDVLPG